jgi:hypothetical protein
MPRQILVAGAMMCLERPGINMRRPALIFYPRALQEFDTN